MIVLALACSVAQAAAPVRPYALEGTEVQSIPSKILHRDYEIFVSLPASYATSAASKKHYPVLFITDANYAFPLIRSIDRRVSDHGTKLEEYILVGLSYAKGDDPVKSRNRDYTPTDTTKNKVNQPTGQAEQYRQFIEKEVFPFVAANYRADMSRKIFSGHSYGSLLGLHVLLTEPQMFNQYVLGSPSLWYDKGVMFDMERSYAASHKDMPAQVFMLVGAFEAVNPNDPNPRYNKEFDMVKDMHTFEARLKSRHYPNLSIHSEVIQDEDHLTVFPSLITRGLFWSFASK
ncbi:MAG: alpha/beta hydrolase-fold protein [Collimonas sp.]|uniref:alpha/beta hydrolase n=1 Tax=Collimonas sp. TaxID=1963772 RepID=UPI003266A7DF